MASRMSDIKIRREQPQDEAFLFELYVSTRKEELDAWGWPPEMRHAFLTMQFKASQGYRGTFPDAEFQIILLDGVSAGRMIVHRAPGELRLVDIALLPQFRNAGTGSALLQRILGEAAAADKPVRLKVLKGNRAERFYHRLGFTKTGETEMHFEMEWRAPVSATTVESTKLPPVS
jgi:ribosomal protein S18 acetylase RimI-like enzyme